MSARHKRPAPVIVRAMSIQKSTENKSLEPVEDKAAKPAVEDKAAKLGEGQVRFGLAHHVSPGDVDEKAHAPGDVVVVDADYARQLREAGYGSEVD